MYVELTSRNTGKTTRLIDSVIEFLLKNPNNSALIVGHDNWHRKNIQQTIHDKCGRPCEYRTITSHKMLPPVPNATIKQFVDEFWLLDEDKLLIDENAYYTGTRSSFNEKAQTIWEHYKNKKREIQPELILKKHKLC